MPVHYIGKHIAPPAPGMANLEWSASLDHEFGAFVSRPGRHS